MALRQVRVADDGMIFVVFQAIEVFVAFATYFASIGFVLLHAQRSGVRGMGFWVNDGEGPIVVRS